MIIDFDERKFKNEVLDMIRFLGLSKSQTEEVIAQALTAVRKASKPVKQ